MRLNVWMTVAAAAIVMASLGCGDDSGNAATPPAGPDDQGAAGMTGAASNTSSSSDPSSGATETNALPAPCDSDEMCPTGVQCVLPEGGGSLGFCDVSDTSVEPAGGSDGASSGSDPSGSSSAGTTLATPAPCETADDCPAGIECMRFDPAGPGFCNVDEMQAP